MSTAKELADAAWQTKWAMENAIKANAAVEKLLADQKKAEATTTPEDRFATVDWTKPLPEFMPLYEPDFVALKSWDDDVNKRPEYGAALIAKWTDEAVAAAEAPLAEALAADQRVREHNAKVYERWSLFLGAHGVESGGRVDVRDRVRQAVTAKFLNRIYGGQSATRWVERAHNASGGRRSGRTVASIREDARVFVAAAEAKVRAEREARNAAEREANRLYELERENARLKMAAVLNAPLPPKPVVKPAEPVTHGERTALLELE